MSNFSIKALKSTRKDTPKKESKSRIFTNHANTINTKKATIQYPKNDNALKGLIDKAKKDGKRLRVIGNRYSSSHTIMHEYEDGKVIVISLKKYKTKIVNDFTLDIRENTVTVHAGYTIGQLDTKIKECTKPGPNQRQASVYYELHTYPSNPEYTIGGCIATPAYGGNISEGLFYDAVIRIRVMNSEGTFQWIEGDDFLKFYKGSMGCFGVITHAVLRIKEAKPTTCILSSLPVGLAPSCVDIAKPDNAKNYLKKYLKNIVQKSQHSLFVFDMYTNYLTGYGWVESAGKHVSKIHSTPKDSNGNEMLSPFSECVLDVHNEGTPFLRIHKTQRDNKVRCNFRRCKAAMKGITSIHCWDIEQKIRQNVLSNNNYMWDVNHPHTLHMTYFIPVDKDFNSVYSTLKVISEATLKLTNESHYCPEMPAQFQFVQSSKGVFSPVKDGQMYMAITLQTMAFTIKTENRDLLSTAWRNYYCEIEEGFLNLNGIPDYSGVYGFSEPDEILNDDAIKDLLTSKEKKKVSLFLSQSDTNGVLQSMYMQQMTDAS